jgi:valyl-tRNA synthetase
MDKNYDFQEEEPKIQKYWEDKEVFKFNPISKKPIYSIDTPPPTVSGAMHIGHAFSYAQQDFIVRYKRMKGFNVFYPFGTDNNGLATERLVEKMNKVKSKKMEREAFRKLCIKTLSKLIPEYIEDWKRIGTSCDFDLCYSTIDDHAIKISQRSFLNLYKEGREYRKEAPTMWCPQCQTAIAQVELEDRELKSQFNDIIFKGENDDDLIIATTRPELLPSCVAVFAHPDDERYKKLFGKKAKVPLFNRKVPIMEDARADPEKGTGLVMCCTFGDQTDIEWYKAHKLPLIMSITEDGKMNKNAGKYEGLPIKEARKLIIEELRENKLLIKEEKITHPVNVHERCGTEVEILNTKQWFIKYLDLKDHFFECGKQMRWYPQHMKVRLDHWIKGLQWDWCISRQRFFGIPFPVWYCKDCGEVNVANEKDLPVDPLTDKPKKPCKCGSKNFIPEKDVMDTWATSSLTPQLAVELMKGSAVYKKLFPMDLRPQAHDIITFWLFNTMVKSQLHENVNPWKNIMISGFALDPHGKKMSKSKGNVVKPQDVIEKYGADAMRFWAAGSKLGEDLPYQEKDIVTGKKMVTKLWNASKFVLMHLEDYKEGKVELELMDKWLISKLNRLITESTDSFEEYEYARTKAHTELFFWQTFCDNYLEIVKDRLYNPDRRGDSQRKAAQTTLYTGLLTVLKLMAPIMPYITEAVYKQHFSAKEKCDSIHISKWPEPDVKLIDEEIERIGDLVIEIIANVRKQKSEKKLSLKTELSELIVHCPKKEQPLIKKAEDDLLATTKADKLVFVDSKEQEPYVEIKLKEVKE